MGGLVGGAFVEAVIALLKRVLDFFAGQATWVLIVVPLVGLSIATLVLERIGRSGVSRPADAWRTFPPGAIRRDITGNVVDTAGREETFPWQLAPLRLVAIFATVGLGAGMGTEAPAAYLGIAMGACLGDRGRRWRRLLRPAALGGGAAGVAVLMGIPLVGTGYVLEIGRRNGAPYSAERVLPALIGGGVGWLINIAYDVQLIRLVVPHEPPASLRQALITVCLIGALSGAITSLAASAVYLGKKWQASALIRLGLGALIAGAASIALCVVAEPSAAFGPGGGAITWAETHAAPPLTLLLVDLLRAASTAAAVSAGGCGGVFVPFLAIGDIAGRVFAPGLGVGNDLAGAAGAAGGIAGGYRLPLTAVAMVLGVGGPPTAQLTCLGVVLVAHYASRLNPFAS
ncbi:MAG TPA: chloride channel protein [Polyangiaceae bacterium]|jgi:H+/Cl- antiporter ClcA|nr:chloride channel protein [Polyangiaceae bacterium]